MKINEQLRTEMFERVELFGNEQKDKLQLNDATVALFAENKTTIDAIRFAVRYQITGKNTRTSGTDQRALVVKALVPLLQSIAEIARTLVPEEYPGVAAKFPAPNPRNYPGLIAQAESVLEEAVKMKAVFVDGGLPENFDVLIEDLVARFQAASSEQESGVQTRTNQTATIAELVRRGMQTVRKIRAALRYKLANDPALAVTWTRAARVESGTVSTTVADPAPQQPSTIAPGTVAQ